jgi:putative mycofactocin binding protein MftB
LTACAASTDFDLNRAWRLNPQVSIRPERFGALLYHFGTRRLSFLKNTTIVEVVRGLQDAPTARDACTAAGVTDAEMAAYGRALASLAASDTIYADVTS